MMQTALKQKFIQKLTLALACQATLACHYAPVADIEAYQPALLQSTPAALTEIKAIMQQSLGGRQVPVATSLFQQTSHVDYQSVIQDRTIEQHRHINGLLLTKQRISFQLLTRQQRCYLKNTSLNHRNSGKIYALTTPIKCRAVPTEKG